MLSRKIQVMCSAYDALSMQNDMIRRTEARDGVMVRSTPHNQSNCADDRRFYA